MAVTSSMKGGESLNSQPTWEPGRPSDLGRMAVESELDIDGVDHKPPDGGLEAWLAGESFHRFNMS
jgi:hypothetical protein